MEVFNIISGVCSIVGLIISCISFAKITQIHNTIKINQTLDKSNNMTQNGIGIGNKNVYKGENKNG